MHHASSYHDGIHLRSAVHSLALSFSPFLDTLKPKTIKNYHHTLTMLCAVALQGMEEEEELMPTVFFEGLIAEESQVRAIVLKVLVDRATTKDGAYVSSQHLQRMRSIIEHCCGVEQRTKVAIAEVEAAERIVRPAINKKQREKRLVAEMSTISDILQAPDNHALPDVLMKTPAPSLERRREVHSLLHKATLRQLRNLDHINYEARTKETRLLIFKCLFLISESVLPQRTSPWVTAKFGNPVVKFTDDDVIDTDMLDKSPCYITWRASEHSIRVRVRGPLIKKCR